MKQLRQSETPKLTEYKKQLRKSMTFEEVILWQRIRKAQLGHCRIRRQVVIAGYIVDFASLPAKLVIEIDGAQHFEPQALIYDEQRTQTLNELGFTVLRFTNQQIKYELDNVLEAIYLHLNR